MNKQTILIIDDEIQIRRLLRITLEAQNFRVEEAETGQSGIVQAAMVRLLAFGSAAVGLF